MKKKRMYVRNENNCRTLYLLACKQGTDEQVTFTMEAYTYWNEKLYLMDLMKDE